MFPASVQRNSSNNANAGVFAFESEEAEMCYWRRRALFQFSKACFAGNMLTNTKENCFFDVELTQVIY